MKPETVVVREMRTLLADPELGILKELHVVTASLFAQWFLQVRTILDKCLIEDGSTPYYESVRYFIAQHLIEGDYQ